MAYHEEGFIFRRKYFVVQKRYEMFSEVAVKVDGRLIQQNEVSFARQQNHKRNTLHFTAGNFVRVKTGKGFKIERKIFFKPFYDNRPLARRKQRKVLIER